MKLLIRNIKTLYEQSEQKVFLNLKFIHDIFYEIPFLPIAAFLGYEITGLVTGALFLENIFSYPGIGQLFIQSMGQRDFSVVTAIVLFTGFATLLGTLLSDIILSIVDPRIRID